VGLTDDQKAMLRLLAQREEGYEDMAALMGLSVEEVREKVKEALAEVGEEAETPPAEAQAPLPPPEPEPTAVPAPASPGPETQAPAASESEPPKAADSPPAPPGTPSPPKRASRPPKLSLPKPRLPETRGPAVGIVAGALVVVVLVVILIVGGSGGGSSSSETAAAEGGEQQLTAAEEKNLTQAILTPVNGGEASGRALFGRYRKKVLLQVEAQGLEPSGKGKTYTVWLYRSPKLALQIGQVPVGSSGKIAAQFQIPPQLLAYVANGAFNQIDVSLTPTAEYRAAFKKAKGERKLPPHVGESVLRGEITGPSLKKQ
jgi:hypothetical protein